MCIMTKLKFKSDILKSSNKFFFHRFFYKLFIYIYKCLKIYQLNIIKKIKKDNKKKLVEDIKIFLKKKKEKSDNMIQNQKKCLIIIKETIILKNNDLESSFGEEYKDVLKL